MGVRGCEALGGHASSRCASRPRVTLRVARCTMPCRTGASRAGTSLPCSGCTAAATWRRAPSAPRSSATGRRLGSGRAGAAHLSGCVLDHHSPKRRALRGRDGLPVSVSNERRLEVRRQVAIAVAGVGEVVEVDREECHVDGERYAEQQCAAYRRVRGDVVHVATARAALGARAVGPHPDQHEKILHTPVSP